jgi:Mg2+ and Co2+ transporter CorA
MPSLWDQAVHLWMKYMMLVLTIIAGAFGVNVKVINIQRK